MIALTLSLLLGGFLIASAALKAAAPRRSAQAMATFGIVRPRVQMAVTLLVIGLEIAIGVGVIAGLAAAALAGAALMVVFAGALALAVARGRSGRPCGCLGPRSRVGSAGIARNLMLAGLLAALPLMERTAPTGDQWLAIGLVAGLVAIAALAVMVIALAREVAELRMSIGPQMALELEDEGPALGEPSSLADEIEVVPRASLALAVFTSPGCHLCRALEPAIDELERDPLLALARFDEHEHGDIWRRHDIPGSPYAVAMAPDGRVAAKGTFNSFAQLQGLLAAAERRVDEGSVAGAR